MDGLTGDYPEAFSGWKRVASKESLSALGAVVRNLYGMSKYDLAGQVQDLHSTV